MARYMLKNKKLLLLLNALESSSQSIKRPTKVLGSLHFGQTLLKQDHLLSPKGSLKTKDYTTLTLHNTLLANDSRTFNNQVNTEIKIDNRNNGSLQFNNQSQLHTNFNVYLKGTKSYNGNLILGSVFKLLSSGTKYINQYSTLSTLFNSLFSGSRNLGSQPKLNVVLNTILRERVNIASKILLNTVFNTTLFTEAPPVPPRYISHKKLLLLLNALESSRQSSNKIISTFGFTRFGQAVLKQALSLLSSGNLTIADRAVLNKYYNLFANDTRNLAGITTPNIKIDTKNIGNIDIAGKSQLNHLYTLSSLGSRELLGTNIHSIIFELLSDGTTVAEVLGNSELSTIISLLSRAILEHSPQSRLNNTYEFDNMSTLDLAGKLNLDHNYSLYPFGSRQISNNISSNLILDLALLGSRLLMGQNQYDISTLLSTIGTRQFNVNTNLNNTYGLNLRGLKDIGAFSSLSNEYGLSGLSNVELSGELLSQIIFGLAPSLSTDSDSIKQLLFILKILQSQDFTLNVTNSKSFNLKI